MKDLWSGEVRWGRTGVEGPVKRSMRGAERTWLSTATRPESPKAGEVGLSFMFRFNLPIKTGCATIRVSWHLLTFQKGPLEQGRLLERVVSPSLCQVIFSPSLREKSQKIWAKVSFGIQDKSQRGVRIWHCKTLLYCDRGLPKLGLLLTAPNTNTIIHSELINPLRTDVLDISPVSQFTWRALTQTRAKTLVSRECAGCWGWMAGC